MLRASALVLPRGLRPGSALALAGLALLVLIAVIGPLLVPYDPLSPDPKHALMPPHGSHPFGTDQFGRDILSRVVAAARLDLGVAFAAVLASLVTGTILGAFAGWAGGWTDRIVGRLVDTIMAFPLFVLAVGIAAGLGNSISSVVIATAIVNLPFYARQVRAEVSRRRDAAYVEAASLAGLLAAGDRFAAHHAECRPAADGAVVAQHGMGDPECGGPFFHRTWRAAAAGRMGHHGLRRRDQYYLRRMVDVRIPRRRAADRRPDLLAGRRRPA